MHAFLHWQGILEDLVRIPSISASRKDEVMRCANATAEVLREHRIDNVTLLDDAVYGDVMIASDAPTVLVYGHHDVQPPGALERWTTPPFEPHIRDGRMFGRGTSDDKGGFLAHVAAVVALRDEHALPCNIKFMIEGEEEIGSPNLQKIIDAHRERLACDYVVLCDTPNFATGVPALTYRLRGNIVMDVEVKCLERPLHSGRGGGIVPDAVQILCGLISRLEISDDDVVDDPAIAQLPFQSSNFGLLDGVKPLAHASWQTVWARPSLTITAFEASSIAEASNQILPGARARLSIRTVPRMDGHATAKKVAEALKSDQAIVETNVRAVVPWWSSDPDHALYAVARTALERGFGSKAVMMGSGGSIGFVEPFARLLRDVPPLLTGVQDPVSNAHSEDESLHLGDWKKSMDAAAHLYAGIAEYHHQ